MFGSKLLILNSIIIGIEVIWTGVIFVIRIKNHNIKYIHEFHIPIISVGFINIDLNIVQFSNLFVSSMNRKIES